MNATITIAMLVGITIAIVASAIIYEKRKARFRREKIQSQAEELGLVFAPDDQNGLGERTAQFQLFNKGRKRKILNVVVGETDAIGISIFEYQYTTGGGEHQQRHKRSVALLESEQFQVPPFTLRPEGMFAKLGTVFGMQDIDFESHPEFSKRYLLKSKKEQAVRDFFDDSILSLLQSRENICVEAVPGKMIVYPSRGMPNPDQLKGLFAEALEIYQAFDNRIREIG